MDRQLIETTYEMRKLDTSEKIESFDCGDTDLNDFILNESGSFAGCQLCT